MASLQKTKPEVKPRHRKKSSRGSSGNDLMRAMVYQNHCLEIQLVESQMELQRCQQRLEALSNQEARPEDTTPETIHNSGSKTCLLAPLSNNAQSI
ncbi:hypothetical protein THRCLA_23083 [Thraustotheca clavata]|uniref:Uncharacterized protein n=1 Tax=Thraustotheca clavata TaxID=74557 RepID=A0A1V9YF73_9STRA|nr:hypothetical protein THRCLA_23083 [Thraustotheca clavata]